MTPAHQAILKAAVLADPTMSAAWAVGNEPVVVEALNQVDAAYFVWRNNTPTQDIYDAVAWTSMTPVDAPDGTTVWTNRALACQGKQFNLQTLLQGRESINSNKANIRAGLQDSLTGLPSGAGGTIVGAGWTAVKTAMTRNATLAEKLCATGSGTAATPSTLGHDGNISAYELEQFMRA